ncbi:unnamed protein product [Lactuca virosa]|uniref:Uncharacterized protein n=1 Tax=Lactuca virosa TaxID=75947 RepID=A0AAU9NZU9_9ASTR|nr:unnamed protein product [Lactuca virosa]
MNTKRGWTLLSVPTRLRAARAQGMEKKGMKEHTREVTELDKRHKQGAASTRAVRIGNHLKKRERKQETRYDHKIMQLAEASPRTAPSQ